MLGLLFVILGMIAIISVSLALLPWWIKVGLIMVVIGYLVYALPRELLGTAGDAITAIEIDAADFISLKCRNGRELEVRAIGSALIMPWLIALYCSVKGGRGRLLLLSPGRVGMVQMSALCARLRLLV